jgi:outer membrane PBP1 activator LpoA protein
MKALTTIQRCLLGLSALALALTACATTPQAPAQAAAPFPSALIDEARAAADKGDYAVAARHFLELAALSSDASRNEYLLSAAESFWHGNFMDQAKQSLQSVSVAALTDAQRSRWQIVSAGLALSDRNPRAALDALKNSLPAGTPPDLGAAIHELRATAYNQLGNFLESARERTALAPLLGNRDAAQRNEQALWQALMSLSDTALENKSEAPPPDTFSGWLELAAIAKTAHTQPGGIDTRIAAWRNRYPQHPASQDLIASLLAQQPERLHSRPAHIAVLLPLSGPFAKSAEAIRDGFLASYLQRTNPEYRPVIQFYDSSDATAVTQTYAHAVADGADMVVGPLAKDAITGLVQGRAITAPTLALNYIDGNEAVPARLFQFGLAPEDEARMVAERAWLDGHKHALAIIPEGDWGNRTFRAFADHWQRLGGTVTSSQSYAANGNDMSSPLRRLLNIDASEARARALRAVLQSDIKFEAWRRHDADFIFMLAFPLQARQIPPQLKFLYAGNLPIYATSHIFDGRLDQAKDRDLDGVMFPDIPWLLTPQQFPLRNKTRELWPEAADQYARLYALGVDAYRVIPYLDSLSVSPYEEFPGATGRLVIDKNNHIRRILLWARFAGGTPRLLPETAMAPR